MCEHLRKRCYFIFIEWAEMYGSSIYQDRRRKEEVSKGGWNNAASIW